MSVSGETQSSGNSSITSFFTAKTPILGLQLYIVIAATVIIMVVILFLICLLIRLNRTSKRNCIGSKKSSGLLPLVADVIRENRTTDLNEIGGKIDRKKEDETIAILRKEAQEVLEIESEGIKGSSGSNESSTSRSDTSSAISGSNESTNIGWGRWYSLKELEMATNGFRAENVIGEGGYGVVFRGELQDGSVVAVKKLLNNKWVLFNFTRFCMIYSYISSNLEKQISVSDAFFWKNCL